MAKTYKEVESKIWFQCFKTAFKKEVHRQWPDLYWSQHVQSKPPKEGGQSLKFDHKCNSRFQFSKVHNWYLGLQLLTWRPWYIQCIQSKVVPWTRVCPSISATSPTTLVTIPPCFGPCLRRCSSVCSGWTCSLSREVCCGSSREANKQPLPGPLLENGSLQ